MSLNYKDKLNLLTMSGYIEDIELTCKRFGLNETNLAEDTDFYNSVSMSLFQLGECKRKLSSEFLERYDSYFPWDKLRRFQNNIGHDYLSVSLGDVWNHITQTTPVLKEAIQRILNENRG